MKYAKIMKNDIANGEGICVSFWAQGCPHRCKGCHNPETWNENGGKEGELSDVIGEILESISARGIKRGFSVLGGEPLAPYNVSDVETIISEVRFAYPDIKIHLWTGYTLENLTDEQLHAIRNVDVLVDGRFEEGLKDLTLKLRGSSNQRILYKENIYGEIEKREGKLPTTSTTGVARLKE